MTLLPIGRPESRSNARAGRQPSFFSFISASVNGRTRIARTAPVVFQVQKPNGLHFSHSLRIVIFLSFVSRSTIWSASIHVRMRSFVTRRRTLYHLSFANSLDPVVSFSEASWWSTFESPTPIPPQPPTTSEQDESPTGNVAVQKKSP